MLSNVGKIDTPFCLMIVRGKLIPQLVQEYRERFVAGEGDPGGGGPLIVDLVTAILTVDSVLVKLHLAGRLSTSVDSILAQIPISQLVVNDSKLLRRTLIRRSHLTHHQESIFLQAIIFHRIY